MQHANPTGENRKIEIAVAKPAPRSDGLIEIAILSLAGLAFTLMMIAYGFFLDGLMALAQ